MNAQMKPGDNRLRGIDPEKLLILDVDELPDMLEVQYAGIAERGMELLSRVVEWKEEHQNGAVAIANEVENGELSDIMKQLRDFAGDNGEVYVTRRKVKTQPYEAIKKIDGWFNNLSDPILEVLGVGKAAPVGTMQYAQTQYLVAKGRREQAERDEVARKAQAAADEMVREARLLAESEASRATVGKAIDRAVEAEDTARATADAAAAPMRDMVRSRSAVGTTSTLASTWEFTLVDMKALCAAVAAGTVPVTFVTTNDQAIRLAIRAKQGALRGCPGLDISQTFSARR